MWLMLFTGDNHDCVGRMPDPHKFEQHLANVEIMDIKEEPIRLSGDYSSINVSYTGDI